MNAETPMGLVPPVLPDQNIFRSPEEMRSMRYAQALLAKLAVPPSQMPAYMRDLARRGGGVTGIGQDMLHSARFTPGRYGVAHDPFRGRMIPKQRFGVRGLGAATKQRVNLQDPNVMKELKVLITLIKPHYADKGDAWFAELTWTAQDWVAYESVVSQMVTAIETSSSEKDQLVAHEANGQPVLGFPASEGVGFPSAIGIAAMGDYLVHTGAFPDMVSLVGMFPTLNAYSVAGVPEPPDPGVTLPKLEGAGGSSQAGLGGDSTKLAMIVGGVAAVGLLAFFVLKKKKR